MKKVLIDIDTLKFLLEQEGRKIVGKICKRFEILNDKNDIKKDVKELLYEHNRDIFDIIITLCKEESSIHLTNLEE